MGKIIYNYGIYFLLSVISQFFDLLSIIFIFLVGIAMVLVLLLCENMTNTNTILAVGIVFQYNTSRIVHLWGVLRIVCFGEKIGQNRFFLNCPPPLKKVFLKKKNQDVSRIP